MNDKDFMQEVEKYLDAPAGLFAENPARIADISDAMTIAKALFEDAKLSFSDDPLYIGSLALRIDFYDMIVRGHEEIELFKQLISKADNFEIGAIGDEKTRMSIMFNNALIRKK